MTQLFRRLVRLISLILVIFIPLFGIYRAMLQQMPAQYIGSVDKITKGMFLEYPFSAATGYMSWLLFLLDKGVGSLGLKSSVVQLIFSKFSGSYWFVTIGGITIADPLAFLQNLVSGQNYSSSLAVAAAIPIFISLIGGRFFCSWVCPVSTTSEIARYIAAKMKLPITDKVLVTNQYLKLYLLIFGLALPIFGLTIFPYILPYVVMGRFFYGLAVGKFLWGAMTVLISIILIDALVQKGFWCNYLCPTGFLLGVLGKRRLITIRHNPEMCREGCSICTNACSWEADPKAKYPLDCTNCGECIEKCPFGALGFITPDPSDYVEVEEKNKQKELA